MSEVSNQNGISRGEVPDKDETEETLKRLRKQIAKESKVLKLRRHRDPLGKVDSLHLVVNSDFHIPPAVPENIPTVSKGLGKLTKSVADKVGSKYFERSENWWMTDLQERYLQTFVAHVEKLRSIFKTNKQQAIEKKENTKTIMINLGDRGMPSVTEGDEIYTALLMAGLTRTLRDEPGSSVSTERKDKPSDELQEDERPPCTIYLPGNHCIDFKHRGPNKLIDEERNFGFQDFYQRVGDSNNGGHLLLGISTPFFNKKGEKRLRKMRDTEDGENAWGIYKREKNRQEELIKEAAEIAKEEGRKVVLMGHDFMVLRKLVRGPMGKVNYDKLDGIIPNVVQIFSGHYHLGRNKKTQLIRNNLGKLGKPVGLTILATPTPLTYGIEPLRKATMDQVNIKPGEPLVVKEIEVKPEEIRDLENIGSIRIPDTENE